MFHPIGCIILVLIASQSFALSPDLVYPEELSSIKHTHNRFDWTLTKSVLNNPCSSCNVLISPISIKLLLSLLEQGTTGKSKEELSVVLPHIHSAPGVLDFWNNTIQSLTEQNKDYELVFASQVYTDKSVSVEQYFINLAKHFFNTNAESLDFSDVQNSVDHINKWVSEKTNNHIKNMVKPESLEDAAALLLNAIYFNGLWESGFPNSTYKREFFVSSKEKIEVQYMIKLDKYKYRNSKALDSEILRLGYKGNKYAMYIVLPNQEDGLNELINKLNNSVLISSELKRMQLQQIQVILPKFKFEHSADFKHILQNVGIKSIFTPSADFEKIFHRSNLMISNVIQKTGIVVDEDGTVAYGATEIDTSDKIMSRMFAVTHPFVFFIEDETTGALLFTGKVARPKM